MNSDLLIIVLGGVILAWLCVIWYLYRYYSAKQNSVGTKSILQTDQKGSNENKTYQLNTDSPRSIGDFVSSLKSESSSKPRPQDQQSAIIEDAVSQAKKTLEDTDYFKKDIALEIEKSLRDVEENTSRLLEGESEALDQQYKNLLAQMQEAIVKARETLVNTEYIREDLIKELESNLNKVGLQLQDNLKQQSDAMSQEYKDLLKEVRADYLKQSEKSAEEFEAAAKSELDEFQKELKAQTIDSEHEMQSSIKTRFDQMQQELEAYRADQMKQIGVQTNQILEDVTKKILGKSLSVSDQQELVMAAVDEAKREGMFSS